MKLKLWFGIVMVLININVFAQSSKEVVIELMDKSNSTTQLKQLDALINAKIEEKKSSFDNEETYKKFASVMQSSFNSQDAEKYFLEYFEQNANEDSLKKVIALYNNPTMKAMNKIEAEAMQPSKQQEQMAFFQDLKDNPPSQSRIQQLILLNNTLGTSEMTMQMVQNMLISIAKGINNYQPADQQIPLNELEQNMASILPANFSQQLTNQLVAVCLYIYKDVSDETLNEYIKTWQTPIGKYYISQIFTALEYAFTEMGLTMGNSFKAS